MYMKQENPKISIVLPVYNNKRLAEESVKRVCSFLREHFDSYEVIVVDDGSSNVERLNPASMPVGVIVVRNKINRGKGFAVKRGMLLAEGDCRIFTDIDLPYDLSCVLTASRIIFDGDCHFVVGDRLHVESTQEKSSSWSRTGASFLFRKFLPVVILGRSVDTQCGFKACSGLLAEHLYPHITINGFAFDMELFFLLAKNDVKIASLPVCLVNSQDSSVRVLWDGLRMVFDGLMLPTRWYLGLHKACRSLIVPDNIKRNEGL